MFVGIGTVVNTGAVILGGILGLLLKKGINERLQEMVTKALGLCVIFIGAIGVLTGLLYIDNGAIKSHGIYEIMILIASIVIGSVIGELINIEKHLENLGAFIKRKVKAKENDRFIEGFVDSFLITCVGAMTVIGAFNDALLHDPSTLFIKSILDGIILIVLTSAMGIGCIFSAIPLFIYQGLLTVLAGFINPLVSGTPQLTQFSYVGSILVFAIGINLTFGKKIRVGNMIPALLIPFIWALLRFVF